MELNDTIEMMASEDYKESFKAEYYQTKIRYEKLKAMNVKIEAANLMREKTEELANNCPIHLLMDQQRAMGEYIHILEVRAAIEGVEL